MDCLDSGTTIRPKICKKRKSQEDQYGENKRNKIEESGIIFKSTKANLVEWFKLISRDTPDKQYSDQYLQLQCLTMNCPNSFLFINDAGEVVSNGSRSDPRTFLDIIHWFPINQSECQIVGRCHNGKRLILYMDGDQIKTKEFQAEKNKDYAFLDRSTVFQFLSRDGKPISNLPMIIKGDNGTIFKFDSNGKFQSNTNKNRNNMPVVRPSYFYPWKVVNNTKETSL